MTVREVDVNTNGNPPGVSASNRESGGTSMRAGARREGAAPAAHVGGLELPVPAEWVDALAVAVAERLELAGSSPWLDRVAAAVYLGVAVSRLEKDRTVPCHRWEGRVLYHRAELDEWLLGLGPR